MNLTQFSHFIDKPHLCIVGYKVIDEEGNPSISFKVDDIITNQPQTLRHARYTYIFSQ